MKASSENAHKTQALASKNRGSVVRDDFASERTLLACLRTGLGFVALGIAFERFSQLDISALQGAPARLMAQGSSALAQKDLKEDKNQGPVFTLLVAPALAPLSVVRRGTFLICVCLIKVS